MATIIFVHGSWQGAWVWKRLVPYLQATNHKVFTPNMPGRANNQAAIEQQTMNNYVATVVQIIDQSSEAVFLVGHSAGGAVISQVAEHRPDCIHALIYIAGFMLVDGQSIMDVASRDSSNKILPNCKFEEKGALIVLRSAMAHSFLYADSDKKLPREGKQNEVVDAAEPMYYKLKLSNKKYASVQRYYIETLQDKSLSNTTQNMMIDIQPPKKVVSINAGHFPFLSKPAETADHIKKIINESSHEF